jgi:hypothetical protein
LTRIATSNEEGVDAAYAGVSRIVLLRVAHSAQVQLLNPVCGIFSELFDFSELYRFGRARGCTRRLQSDLLPVIAKCTFESSALLFTFLDDSEWAGYYAIGAAITDIILQEDAAELSANDSARRACFQASGILTVFTDIR